MPKYDFICVKCGKTIEDTVNSDIINKVCDCGGTMKRQFPTSFSTINTTQTHHWWRSHPDPEKDKEMATKSLRKKGYGKRERARLLEKEFKNIEGGKQ